MTPGVAERLLPEAPDVDVPVTDTAVSVTSVTGTPGDDTPAADTVRWAVDRHGDGLCVLSSGQDAVLIDVVLSVEPTVPVVFLDTGFHFPETIETMLRIVERYRPRLEVIAPVAPPRRCRPARLLLQRPQGGAARHRARRQDRPGSAGCVGPTIRRVR